MAIPGMAGFATCVVSLLTLIVGYGAPFWFWYSNKTGSYTVSWGLWIGCIKYNDKNICCTYATTPGFLKAVQALSTIALVAIVIAGILFAIWMFIQRQGSSSGVAIAVVCLTVLAGISTGVALIITAAKKTSIEKDILQVTTVPDTGVHWALVLLIISCVGAFASGVCAIIELVRQHVTTPTHVQYSEHSSDEK